MDVPTRNFFGEHGALADLVNSAAKLFVSMNIMKKDLYGQDGKRQIDILMTADLRPFKVKTIVGCRDYGKILDVTHIDGLHSKMQDVGAHQAAIVTRKG